MSTPSQSLGERNRHDVGVVRADAKADNILIDKNDDTWIIDFGLDKTSGPPRVSGQCKG